MWKKVSCAVLFLGLVALDLTKAFSLTKSEPDPSLTVKEGGSFELNCEVDNYYEYCKFIHNGKICDYEWKRDVWNITVADCADYADRVVWSGNYDYYKCAVTITDARPEDAGAWSCELESYAAGKYRGYGYNVTSKFDIDFIAKTTTTTSTTTTTTVTTTTTTLTTTKSTTSESEAVPVEEVDEDITDVEPENQNADPEAKDDEKDYNALFVIIAILVIVVVIGIVMYGLHYKGKLPQTFYNFGGRQWKPVKANEEHIIDEDEKKPIVKNGKKLENGGADETTTTIMAGDSANIDPSLTEVAFTTDEKKPNGNGTVANGTGNGTAPAPAESAESAESETTEATEAKKVEESEPLKEKEEQE